MTKQEQIDTLAECVLVELSIKCEKCLKGESFWFGDEIDFAMTLYKKGWRYKDEMCLCPGCVKTVK